MMYRIALPLLAISASLVAQIFLPARRPFGVFVGSGTPIVTNLLGGVAGEHPVLYQDKVYVALFNREATNNPAGLGIVDALTGLTDNIIVITNNTFTSAPFRDINGKWHMWAYDGSVYRVNAGTLSVEAGSVGAFKVGIDWESLCSPDGGSHIIVPATAGAGGGIKAISVSNYASTLWSNTDPVYDTSAGGLTTPAITHAGGFLWVLDHRGELWKINATTGATISSIQPVALTCYQYSTPVRAPDTGDIFYSNGDAKTFYCLDPAAMTNKWSYTMPYKAHRPPSYKDGVLYVTCLWTNPLPARAVSLALNATNGTAIWRNNYCMENQIHIGAPFMDDEYVFLATHDAVATNRHDLYAIDLTNGRQAGLYQLYGNVSSGTPQVWKGKFFCPLWENNGMHIVQYRTTGTGNDRLWHSDTNYTANITGNSAGSLIYPAPLTFDITNGLTASWWMDEAAGNRVDDVAGLVFTNFSANAGTGVISNCVTTVRASSHYMQTGDHAAIRMSPTGYSITCWVRFTSISGVSQVILRKGNGAGTDWLFSMSSAASGGSDNFRWVNVTTAGLPAPTLNENVLGAVSAGVWYFVCIWDDRAANKIYIQVNLLTPTSMTVTDAAADGGRDLYMGAATGTANFFDGDLDEVKIWNRTISMDERTWLYDVGRARREQ